MKNSSTDDPIEKPFHCELCGTRYKTRPGLTYHYIHYHRGNMNDYRNPATAANMINLPTDGVLSSGGGSGSGGGGGGSGATGGGVSGGGGRGSGNGAGNFDEDSSSNSSMMMGNVPGAGIMSFWIRRKSRKRFKSYMILAKGRCRQRK